MDSASLIESYASERIKTLSVWSHFNAAELRFRATPHSRSPLEHMVHQCVSEDYWMRTMLGIDLGRSPLPAVEDRGSFLRTYAADSGERESQLREQSTVWFAATTSFFGLPRRRDWVLIRRLTHTAHHRGQMTLLLRLLGRPLYSTYGPTADTGGLFQNAAEVIYRYPSIEDLLEAEAELEGGHLPELPGPGLKPVSERPGP